MQSAKGNRGRHTFKCLDAAAPATVKEIGSYSPYLYVLSLICLYKNRAGGFVLMFRTLCVTRELLQSLLVHVAHGLV